MKTFRLSSKPSGQLITTLGNVLEGEGANGLITISTLNPEQVVQAVEDDSFSNILSQFTICVADGVGLIWGAFHLSGKKVYKTAGVDLAQALVSIAIAKNQPILFLGGIGKTSEKAKTKFLKLSKKDSVNDLIISTSGYRDISKPTDQETRQIFNLIKKHRPKLVLVGFGAPFQETWIIQNQKELDELGIKIAMVVGGAFDYWSGKVGRAPSFISNLGFEWLYRLIRQPWRLKRQLRLIKFVFLVLTKQIDFEVK